MCGLCYRHISAHFAFPFGLALGCIKQETALQPESFLNLNRPLSPILSSPCSCDLYFHIPRKIGSECCNDEVNIVQCVLTSSHHFHLDLVQSWGFKIPSYCMEFMLILMETQCCSMGRGPPVGRVWNLRLKLCLQSF